MEAKVRAATGERLDPSTFIFARTDARAVHGLDDAMRRAERYLRAGADGLFIEAPEVGGRAARIGRAFDVPLLANPLEGGKTPLLSPTEFAELGFSVIPVRNYADFARCEGDAGGDRRRDVGRFRAARRGDELHGLSRR